MFQRLLICTDLSDGLQRLVHFVPSLAATNLKQLIFLHCVPVDESGIIPKIDEARVEYARQQLAVAQANAPAGITVTVAIESGRPNDLILKAVQDYQADLLMLGYPLRNSFSEKIFGSTALEIYSKINIPILSIRPQLISTYTTEELDLRLRHIFRHFMVPYDGSDGAKHLIQKVKQYASHQTQPLLTACNVCWVLDDVERRDIPQKPFIEAATQKLAVVKQELEAVNLTVTTEIRKGTPIVEIVAACLAPDVSVIAVCHTVRSRFLQIPAPSFARELLHYSWHPVLYFPFGG